jgi:hypothetical protein
MGTVYLILLFILSPSPPPWNFNGKFDSSRLYLSFPRKHLQLKSPCVSALKGYCHIRVSMNIHTINVKSSEETPWWMSSENFNTLHCRPKHNYRTLGTAHLIIILKLLPKCPLSIFTAATDIKTRPLLCIIDRSFLQSASRNCARIRPTLQPRQIAIQLFRFSANITASWNVNHCTNITHMSSR